MRKKIPGFEFQRFENNSFRISIDKTQLRAEHAGEEKIEIKVRDGQSGSEFVAEMVIELVPLDVATAFAQKVRTGDVNIPSDFTCPTIEGHRSKYVNQSLTGGNQFKEWLLEQKLTKKSSKNATQLDFQVEISRDGIITLGFNQQVLKPYFIN